MQRTEDREFGGQSKLATAREKKRSHSQYEGGRTPDYMYARLKRLDVPIRAISTLWIHQQARQDLLACGMRAAASRLDGDTDCRIFQK